MNSASTRTAIQAALAAAFLAIPALGAAPPPGVAPPPDELDAIAGATAPVPIELGELSWRYPTSGVTRNGDILVAEVPPSENPGTAWAQADLDLAPYAGRSIRFTIHARGTGVGKPRIFYLGLKFMVKLEAEDGTLTWPDTVQKRTGDWENDLTCCCDLGAGVKSAVLVLGLQAAPGRVEFDLSTLRAEDVGVIVPRVNQSYKVSYPDAVRDRGLMRGVMLPIDLEKIREDDFATLEQWGATLVRYQMSKHWADRWAWERNEDFDKYMDFALGILATNVLPWAEKHGQKVVVDMHATPGARNDRNENRMFYEDRYADHYVAVWRRIAERFKGDRRIYGYDLVNEPLQSWPAPHSYLHLQLAAARAIREADPDATIIVAANGCGDPAGFATLSPLAMDNIIYQPHFYSPHEYTHQGVFDRRDAGTRRYPDPGMGWDKEYIRRQLAPVRDFQLRHGAKIYVGEFSAAVWAPGAGDYLRDCIEIFEEYGWDWTYHAFREWDGWSVEREWKGMENGCDAFVPSADNPRKRALLDGFARGRAADAPARPQMKDKRDWKD